MPRNTKQKTYLSVAVPMDSRLMKQLEQDFAETHTPKSHILLGYAKEYVRLFIDGEIGRVMPNGVIYTPPAQPKQELAKSEGGRTFFTGEATDEDLDAAFNL